MKETYGIHWFRRDLRVDGNPALTWHRKEHQGRVLGAFFFDRTFLSRPDFSHHRFQFFLNTLRSLKSDLKSRGGDLLFLDEPPLTAIPQLLTKLSTAPKTFSWNRDYEPFAKIRDAKVERLLTDRQIQVYTARDHLLIEPSEIYKNEDPAQGYQVFTPFSKKWLELFHSPEVQERIIEQGKRMSSSFKLSWADVGQKDRGILEQYLKKNMKSVTISIPEGGSDVAALRMKEFAKHLSGYEAARNIPSIKGTSQLSLFLKNGSVTTAQIIAQLNLAKKAGQSNKGKVKYLNELIWREFYYHILARNPDVEHHAFQKRFENIRWENREEWFEAWKQGKTGFPIVDAGMRQLNSTGWMHNRVRMIVASFLTKDLLIDWRWGEKYFMEKLLDGDLAANNGGWQWAASTGCDPQPYFRIFNPLLQSQKFDPEGVYIKEFIPELRHLSDKSIHAPHNSERKGYPRPIVDHAMQRSRALKLYSPLSRNNYSSDISKF